MYVVVNEENGYESSVDNDDDISSDEDPDVEHKLEAEVGRNTCNLTCSYFWVQGSENSRMVQSIIKISLKKN